MAWQDTLYDASFKGVPFEYMGVDDSHDKALATHQAPYANDAIIHDMGNNPKSISLTAIIDGDDYEQALDDLLNALDSKGAGTLVHPVFGEQNAICSNYRVKHDSEIVDGCTVDMQFVLTSAERAVQYFTAETLPPRNEQADSLIMAKAAAELTEYQDQLATMSNAEAVAQSRSIPETIRSKLRNIRTKLGTNLVRVDDLLSPPVWLGSIVSDVDSIVKMLPIDYDPAANWRRLFNRIGEIGNVFDDSDIAPLRRAGRIIPAAMVGRAVTSLLELELVNQSMTPTELVAINDEARAQIQDAITALRSDTTDQSNQNLPVVNHDVTPIIADLKKAAAQLQLLTDAVINARPPLVVYNVVVPSTLRLIAHHLYGDHKRADELSRLNRGLENPTIILPGTQVSAYAV